MPGESKRDVTERQRELHETTDGEVSESDDIASEGADAAGDWSDQSEPSLTDTADALNAIAGELRTDIQRQHETQADVVDGAVEQQRQEVSEPARSDEQSEQQAGNELREAASDRERFGHILAEAADAREDAEEFHREVAETDESDQAESKDALEQHRRAVDTAIRSIQDL